MKKMNEVFVETINQAILNADLVSDKYQKAIAYATTAQALATYLVGAKTDKIDVAETSTRNIEEKAQAENIPADQVKISAKNKEMLKAMDEAINKVSKEKEEMVSNWELKFDENGIPFLEDEDHAYRDRVEAYELARLTPEVQAKIKEQDRIKGEKLIAEMEAKAPSQPVSQAPTQVTSKEYIQSDLDKLEEYKAAFGYTADPTTLDNLFLNFTDAAKKTLAELTPDLLTPFLLFVKEEIAKAYDEVESWKESWITKEGLDSLISQAYGVEGATLEQYLHDGNVQWFVDYIRHYNANAYFQGWYAGQIDRASLDAYVRECFEDSEMNADSINETNVMVIYSYISAMTQQTA